MEGLLERITTARVQVQRSLAERARLSAAVEALEARVRECAREGEVLKARIQELEQENEVLRTVKATDKEAQREGVKEEIDELVHDIDRCLALLNG